MRRRMSFFTFHPPSPQLLLLFLSMTMTPRCLSAAAAAASATRTGPLLADFAARRLHLVQMGAAAAASPRAASRQRHGPLPFLRRWINSARLTVEEDRELSNAMLAEMPPKEKLTFGTTLSGHMLRVEWDRDREWGDPRIVPLQDLKLSPAASSLHYGAYET